MDTPFWWRKLWSVRVPFDAYGSHLLRFASSGGVVLVEWRPPDSCLTRRRVIVVDRDGEATRTVECVPLGSWCGDAVFCLKGHHLFRTRNDRLDYLDMSHDHSGLYNVRNVWTSADGTLMVHAQDQVCTFQDKGGEMKKGAQYSTENSIVTPFKNGFLTYPRTTWDNIHVSFQDPLQRDATKFVQYPVDSVVCSFSNGKGGACFMVDDVLHEWDAQGHERTFRNEDCPVNKFDVSAAGTCLGRAFLNRRHRPHPTTPASDDEEAEAVIYAGDGRFVGGPPGRGSWVACDDRAYLLQGYRLTCFEACHATLLDLCVSRAKELRIAREYLDALPEELRERF